jgi:outer membrane protein assembly factor BamB
MLAAFAAGGADWMQFRGPRGAGTSSDTGLPTTWSATDNVVWRTKLPGPGTSCPIVVGKRVYLTCYSGYGLEPGQGEMDQLIRHLLCLDRGTGAILWTKDFKPQLPESKYVKGNDSMHGYSSSTPTSDGQHLYVFFGKSGVYCLDLDGKELWHADVGKGLSGWGSSNSPVLYQDLVIINASVESNSLVALDKKTGKEVWRTKGIGASWNTPVIVEVPGGASEVVLSESKAVLGFDPESGKELWRVGGYVCPSVMAHKGVVYVVRTGSKDGGALAIKAGGRGEVSDSHVLWRVNGSTVVSSPVYHEGRLYWADGNATCLDSATGKEVFRGRLSGNPRFYASAVAVDGKIYFVSRFTGTNVIAAGPPFKELAHNKFEDDNSRTNSTPIVSEGCLLLRTDRYLYCLGKKS